MLSYAQGTAVFKWTLQEVPKIRFYWLLHTYFQRQGLTHEQMGKVYRAIDPHLRFSTSSNRIACRKVSRMIQNHHNHHNLVQYPNSKTACKNVPKQHVPGPNCVTSRKLQTHPRNTHLRFSRESSVTLNASNRFCCVFIF